MARLAVVFDDAMRGALEALTRAGSTAQKLVQRARIGLLASQGCSDSEISRKLDIDRKTAALWRRRLAEPEAHKDAAEPTAQDGAGTATQEPVRQPGIRETKGKPVSEAAAERLQDRRRRSGRKRVVTAEMRERIIHTTLHVKPEGRTHGTTRSLAKHLGVSKMAVQRVWKAEKLQPHRLETFKFSKDKQFVEKLTDVVGIYKEPPP